MTFTLIKDKFVLVFSLAAIEEAGMLNPATLMSYKCTGLMRINCLRSHKCLC